ncbi:MAG: hypothetical protein O3C69_06925 [Chloroflexi bacterium]|nr:hypothetical protein [Chloroflexota bacterium]
MTSKCVVDLLPGDTVSFQTPGGGGYGPPERRDPARVLDDVVNGKITAERASEVYRVAIDGRSGLVDEAETAKLRSAR